MGTRLHKALILVLVAVLFTGLVAENACADRGPKPQITLTVINYPQGEYYVALLTTVNGFYNVGKATYHMDGAVDDKSVGVDRNHRTHCVAPVPISVLPA